MGARTVVFDTNVFVSGLCFDGKPEQCIELALDDSVDLVISTDVLHELVVVLEYDRLPVSEAERHEFADVVVEASRFVEPTIERTVVADDPDDDKFVECALEADADFIVSGDDHLLGLDSHQGVRIVTPDALLSYVEEELSG